MQIIQRCASRLEAEEKRLHEKTRTAEVHHVTPHVGGMRDGVEKSPLGSWVFADEGQTVFRVEPYRDRTLIQSVLGFDFGSGLVSDCLDIHEEATPTQHQVRSSHQVRYAPHLKTISTAQANDEARADEPSIYLPQMHGLLVGTTTLKKVAPEPPKAQSDQHQSTSEKKADWHLSPNRPLSHSWAIN